MNEYRGNSGNRGYNNNNRGGGRGGGYGGGGGRSNFGPREMHKATCADCGQECEVPFKPKEDRPVYCRDCYAKRRDQEQ